MNKKTPNLRLLDKTEEKDHTRKPVIRDPLPEKDKITLCELITWRATGKARSAAVLRRFMRRHQGQRQSTELRGSLEREAAIVVSLCSKGDLSPNGSVDGNPHQPFSEGYFLSDVYADPVSDSIGPDPRAWPSAGPYPDENPEEPRELPTYRSVRFLRSDLLSTFEPAADDIDQRARQEETADTAPKRRRPRKTTIEDEAKIESKIRTVLEIAVRKWRNTENTPGFRQMARLLIEQEPEVRRLYKEEPVRKILDGTYAASKSRGIPGYVGYSGC